MKINASKDTSFQTSSLITLKDDVWLSKQRKAGSVVAMALTELQRLVKDCTNLTTFELSEAAEKIILDNGCTPTFKNYKGHGVKPFPAAVCISVNNHLVHGIPNDYRLKDGDVVSFDLGATFEGVVADSALTCIFGEPKSKQHLDLLEATNEAFWIAIDSISIGSQLGCIGSAISKKAKEYGFNVVVEYGGHGIDTTVDGKAIAHAPPFVCNKDVVNNGIRIVPGIVLAIEPLLTIGSPKTKVLDDGWTVATENVNCHIEHSIFIKEDFIEIITAKDYESKSVPIKVRK